MDRQHVAHVAPRVALYMGLALIPIALAVVPPMIGISGAICAFGFAALARERKV